MITLSSKIVQKGKIIPLFYKNSKKIKKNDLKCVFAIDNHSQIWYNRCIRCENYVNRTKTRILKLPTAGRQAAQKKYNAKPEQKKRRAQRNKTRRMLERQGRVHKGDGKDIDHKDHNTANTNPSNLQVLLAGKNRKDGGPSAKMKFSRKKK